MKKVSSFDKTSLKTEPQDQGSSFDVRDETLSSPSPSLKTVLT